MQQPEPIYERTTEVYETYAPTVLAYLLRRLGSREDAEDMLLEVFTVVLEKEPMLQMNERAVRAWVLTIARNKVVDFYRRLRRHSHIPLMDVEERLFEHEEHEPEQVFLRQEAFQQLQRHVRSLPAQQQEILQLRFGEGLRCAEIAQIVSKSENAVRALLYRALKLLRGIYDDERAERGL